MVAIFRGFIADRAAGADRAEGICSRILPSEQHFWFVVTRFIASLRSDRINAVTTNKN